MTIDKERYSRVSRRMWGDAKFKALSAPPPNAQTLWQYIITGPHTTNLPGLFVIGPFGLAERLGWGVADTERCFAEIVAQGLVRHDPGTRLTWAPNALAHNLPANPNVVLSWVDAWRELPECPLRDAAAKSIRSELQAIGGAKHPETFAFAFDRVTGKSKVKGYPKRLPDVPANVTPNVPGNVTPNPFDKQEQEQDPSGGSAPAEPPPARSEPPAQTAPPEPFEHEPPGLPRTPEAWRSWRDLYRERYPSGYADNGADGKSMATILRCARATAEEHAPPGADPTEATRQVCAHWFKAFLADDGTRGFLARQRHALKFLVNDTTKHGHPWAEAEDDDGLNPVERRRIEDLKREHAEIATIEARRREQHAS